MNDWRGLGHHEPAPYESAEHRVAEHYRCEYPATFEEALDVLPARAYAEADARITALLHERLGTHPEEFIMRSTRRERAWWAIEDFLWRAWQRWGRL